MKEILEQINNYNSNSIEQAISVIQTTDPNFKENLLEVAGRIGIKWEDFLMIAQIIVPYSLLDAWKQKVIRVRHQIGGINEDSEEDTSDNDWEEDTAAEQAAPAAAPEAGMQEKVKKLQKWKSFKDALPLPITTTEQELAEILKQLKWEDLSRLKDLVGNRQQLKVKSMQPSEEEKKLLDIIAKYKIPTKKK